MRSWPRFIFARATFFVGALFAVTTFSFLLVNVLPGDPARVIAGNLATDERVERIEQELGLDEGLGSRYVDYMSGVAHGDLGTSFYTRRAVRSEIADRLPATVELVALSLGLALTVGISLGCVSGVCAGRVIGRASRTFVTLTQAVPDFFLGLLLIYFLFFVLRWAPAPSGRLDFADLPPPDKTGSLFIDAALAGEWSTLVSALRHAILPVLTLGAVYSAFIARITRATVTEALRSEQAQFARAAGLRGRTVLWYALLEARTSILTYSAMLFAALIGGAAIVESVFAWDGVGPWAIDAIIRLDLPAIQGFVLAAGAITLLTYTLLDVLVAVLDPRVRYG